jgi:hypothetical protein
MANFLAEIRRKDRFMTTLRQVLCYANQPEHIFIYSNGGRGRIFEYLALFRDIRLLYVSIMSIWMKILRYSCDMEV